VFVKVRYGRLLQSLLVVPESKSEEVVNDSMTKTGSLAFLVLP
jgi:hypothetical protein